MICAFTEDILLKELDNTSSSTPIYGCWYKSAQFEMEFAKYIEVEMIEFNADETGVWKHWDNSVFFKTHEDPFTYRIQGRRVIFSYASFPKQYSVVDYRVADGHLILIDNYGTPSETMEVYTRRMPSKSMNKSRRRINGAKTK